MATITAEQIAALNSLLRGELAATETYQQALDKMNDSRSWAELKMLHADHREAANLLRQHIRAAGEEPDHGSGAWGAFAKAVEGTAKLLGETAALKALKEGEESGVRAYEGTLDELEVPAECLKLIRDQILPQTRAHVQALDRMMARP